MTTTAIESYAERLGLTVLRYHDIEGGGNGFDVVVVFRDQAGRVLVGYDQGCPACCAGPFDGIEVADLSEVRTGAEVASFARRRWVDVPFPSDDPEAELECHVTELVDGLPLPWSA